MTSDLLPVPGAQIPVWRDPFEVLLGADAAVLCTEWPEIVDLDFARAAAVMKGTLLVDGRYSWNPVRASEAGLDLVRIGTRPVRARTVGH